MAVVAVSINACSIPFVQRLHTFGLIFLIEWKLFDYGKKFEQKKNETSWQDDAGDLLLQ